MALKERRRSLAGRTGCGLCGVDSLDQVRRTLPSAAAGARRSTPPAWAGAGRDRRNRRSRSDDRRRPRGRLVRHGRRPARRARGRRPPQCAGQGDRRDGAHGACARRRLFADHQPGQFRDGAEGGRWRASACWSACRRRPWPPSSWPSKAGMTLLAFARGQRFVCYTHPRTGLEPERHQRHQRQQSLRSSAAGTGRSCGPTAGTCHTPSWPPVRFPDAGLAARPVRRRISVRVSCVTCS
jgi:FdhD protein